jgi:hypothetical protein
MKLNLMLHQELGVFIASDLPRGQELTLPQTHILGTHIASPPFAMSHFGS